MNASVSVVSYPEIVLLQITVTALSPLSSLSAPEAQHEWDEALHSLRRDGARPKEVGFLAHMPTSSHTHLYDRSTRAF